MTIEPEVTYNDGFDVVEFDHTETEMVAARKAFKKATRRKFRWNKKNRLAWARFVNTLFNFDGSEK